MTDQNHPAGTGDHDSTGWVILGGALIAAGLFLGARTLGILPWPFVEFWGLAVKARFGIGVVVVGILLIIWAQSGRRFSPPAKGTKLHRVREGRWLAGVLGAGQHLSVAGAPGAVWQAVSRAPPTHPDPQGIDRPAVAGLAGPWQVRIVGGDAAGADLVHLAVAVVVDAVALAAAPAIDAASAAAGSADAVEPAAPAEAAAAEEAKA